MAKASLPDLIEALIDVQGKEFRIALMPPLKELLSKQLYLFEIIYKRRTHAMA